MPTCSQWMFLTLLFAQPLGCTVPSPTFCETDQDCEQADQSCDRIGMVCRARTVTDARPFDGSRDAPTLACDKSLCTMLPVAGWSGPVVLAKAAVEDSLPICSGEFQQIAIKQSKIEEQGTCGCRCGTASNLACNGGRLRGWSSGESSCELGQCDRVNGSCLESTLSLSVNGCNEFDGPIQDASLVQASFGTLSYGTCTAPQVDGQLSSRLINQVRLCHAPVSEALCNQEGRVCSAGVPDGFRAGQCMMKEGEHQCPTDTEYSERTLVFASIDDQRSCGVGTCSCSAPTGSCGGRIELTDGGEFLGCTSVLATLQGATSPFQGGDICSVIPAATRMARYVVELEGRACNRSGEAQVLGAVVGKQATTLCCTSTD